MSELINTTSEYHQNKICKNCKKYVTPEKCNYFLQYGILPGNESNITQQLNCHQAENNRGTLWKPKHGYFPQNSKDSGKSENVPKPTTERKITPILGQGFEHKPKTMGFRNPFAKKRNDQSNSIEKNDRLENPFKKQKKVLYENFEQRIKNALEIEDVTKRAIVMQQIAEDKMEFKKLQDRI